MRKTTIVYLPEGTDMSSVSVSIKKGSVEISREERHNPMFGEIVRINVPKSTWTRKYMISIMPDKRLPDDYSSGFFDIATICLNGELTYGTIAWHENFKIEPASESEKAELFEKLAESGRQWNDKEKRIEIWRAKKGEPYFFIDSMMSVCKGTEDCHPTDDMRYRKGNYFKTESMAESYLEKIELLLYR